MRILLDECIDRRLGRGFIDHEVRTVPQMGWAGTLDGDLLPLVAAEFDVFITVDRNLPYQQNLTMLDLAVLVLEATSNRLADLQPLVPLIFEAIPIAPKGHAMTIAIVK
jgi:PIN like domain